MNNQEKEVQSYQVSTLANIFAKNTRYRRLQISAACLDSETHQGQLDYLAIQQAVELKRGIIWDTLMIKTDYGDLQYGGINKSKSQPLANAQNKAIQRYHKQTATQLVKDIRSANNHLSQLNLGHHYVRQQDTKKWLATHATLPSSITTATKKYLPQESLNQLQTIQPFLDNGNHAFEVENKRFVIKTLAEYKDLFDAIESNPLTEKQREACVINEQHNLVLAGAGTGKTSTMVGRAAYLLASGLAKDNEILMLAYGKDAQLEMDARIEKRIPKASIKTNTFHALGLAIISDVEESMPTIHEMASDDRKRELFVEEQFGRLKQDKHYQGLLVQYFSQYLFPYKSPHSFESLDEYRAYVRDNEIRTLQGEAVKSYEECEIANFLYRQGIHYQYEAKYKIETQTKERKQYQPDFYLPDFDIYIEHFAVNQHNQTPPFINQTKYVEGMMWKRKLHQKYETTLIETFSYEKQQGQLIALLDEKLRSAGVHYQPRSETELLDNLKIETSRFSQLISQLLKLFKAAFTDIEQLKHVLQDGEEVERAIATTALFEPIFNAYQAELKQTHSIDFDDMIHRAIQYIESRQYISPFTHILVDEFQDIAAPRIKLIKALMKQRTDATLFCVGDDWQSIYQFTGSDVSFTKQFPNHFGDTATNILDKTFRFNNKISEVASKFIMENPSQIEKQIHAHQHVDTSAVTLIRTKQKTHGIRTALKAIPQSQTKRQSVLILARNNLQKPDNLGKLQKEFPSLNIQFMTIHKSKGKEADFVILTDVNSGKHGLPSTKSTHPLLAKLLPKPESFHDAEERRLFYVALTRAKHHVYLMTDADKQSPFIKEIIGKKYPIITDTFTGSGFQTEKSAEICPECGGELQVRSGQHGKFLGCKNYADSFSCSYTKGLD